MLRRLYFSKQYCGRGCNTTLKNAPADKAGAFHECRLGFHCILAAAAATVVVAKEGTVATAGQKQDNQNQAFAAAAATVVAKADAASVVSAADE